jgi:4-hydroxy-tetrahydrodipicolinate synthase
MEIRKPLRGVIAAMITPLRDRDALDRASLERLIEHLIAGGVHGLFILGTTGEAPGLSHRCRPELIERICEDFMAEPFRAFGSAERAKVRQHMVE